MINRARRALPRWSPSEKDRRPHRTQARRYSSTFHKMPFLSRMQTFEGVHLLRDAHLTKYARDGRVDVAMFTLVFTNEHEDRHFVLLCRDRVLHGGLFYETGASVPSVESLEVPWQSGGVQNSNLACTTRS